MRAKIGEVYCFRLHGGGYGAIQVVAENQDRKSPGVQFVRLDIDTDEPPTARQVDAAQTFHHGKDLYGTWVPPLVPWWAQRVEGAAVRRPACEKEAWSGWRALTFGVPRAVREVYVPRPEWRYDREPITISIGGEPFQMSRDNHLLSTWGRMPEGDGPADWAALAPFPCITSICHSGPDRGLIEAVRTSHPHVSSIAWTAPQTDVIDLRDTFIYGLTLLDVDRPLTVKLPVTARSLDVKDNAHLLTIEAPVLGEHFGLGLRNDLAQGAPKGLEELLCLTISNKTIDLEKISSSSSAERGRTSIIAAFPRLASLTLRDAQSGVRNIGALRGLPNLREFTAYDMYDFDASEFPTRADCPLLHSVEINGLRASDKQTLAKRLKDGPHLAFSKTRSEKWLTENIDNPFRDWDADGAAFGKAAMKAWNAALKQARAIEGTASRAQAREAVLALTEVLNKIDERCSIDTLRREQACDAICVLVRDHLAGALTADETQDIVDEIRNW